MQQFYSHFLIYTGQQPSVSFYLCILWSYPCWWMTNRVCPLCYLIIISQCNLKSCITTEEFCSWQFLWVPIIVTREKCYLISLLWINLAQWNIQFKLMNNKSFFHSLSWLFIQGWFFFGCFLPCLGYVVPFTLSEILSLKHYIATNKTASLYQSFLKHYNKNIISSL